MKLTIAQADKAIRSGQHILVQDGWNRFYLKIESRDRRYVSGMVFSRNGEISHGRFDRSDLHVVTRD